MRCEPIPEQNNSEIPEETQQSVLNDLARLIMDEKLNKHGVIHCRGRLMSYSEASWRLAIERSHTAIRHI